MENKDLSMLDYEIYFGQRCNNNCVMCTNIMPSKKEPQPLSEMISKINKTLSKDPNASFFSITGGEPTLYPKQLFKIMKYILDHSNAAVRLITNGRLFYYKSFTNLFRSLDPSRVLLITEIHGPEELHDKITGVKGSFKQTVEGIKNVRNILGWFIEQRVVLHRLNFRYTKEIVKIGASLGNTKFVIFPIDLVGNAAKNRKKLMITYVEIVPYILEAIDFAVKNNLDIILLHTPKCVLPSKYWKYAFGVSVIEKRLAPTEECKKCDLYSECAKPWKSYIHFVGDFEFKAVEDEERGNYIPFFMKKKKLKPGLNIINASGACNQRCIFCTFDKFLRLDTKDPAMQKPFFEKPSFESSLPTIDIIKRIVENEHNEIVFMGGEPTLHHEIDYLVNFAKRFANVVTINTNGTLLSSYAFAERLKKAGLDRLMISLHGHTAEISEAVSRVKGNFERTVKGIHNAIALGLQVMLVHVLYKGNYKYFPDYVDFIIEEFYKEAKSKNIPFGLSVSMVKPNRFSPKLNAEITPKYIEVLPYLIKGLEKLKGYDISLGLENFPLCLIPEEFRKYSVEANEIKSFGGFDKWMEDRLRNNERDAFGYKGEQCKECKFYNLCQGVLKEYYDLYGTDELKPIK